MHTWDLRPPLYPDNLAILKSEYTGLHMIGNKCVSSMKNGRWDGSMTDSGHADQGKADRTHGANFP